MRVLKFGGSSVADAAAVQAAVEIVERTARDGEAVVVVCSALGGVTDGLIVLAQRAAGADPRLDGEVDAMRARHHEILGALTPGSAQTVLRNEIEPIFEELRGVLRGVALLRELSPSTLDRVMSFGERLSNTAIAGVLAARGATARYVDAREIVVSGAQHGRASVHLDESYARIRVRLGAAKGISVVTGFIASTSDGITTTLGRGGSDYTASLLAAALDADEIEIWTDVDGVLTGDPGKVPLARPIRNLTYEEAMELSHFGAKVIYPPTLQPAFDRGIPIRIRNTFRPQFQGTRIAATNPPISRAIKGTSSIDAVSLLRVQGSGMVGVAGISARLFGALARARVSVIMITQGSSEHSISLAVAPDRAERARMAIDEEFAAERRARLVDPVRVESDRAVIAVVGENMRATPGISAIIFSALGREHVNVVAIAQGSSERNVSIVVEAVDEERALRTIHDAFFQEETDYQRAELFQIGAGVVGGTLLAQLADHAERLLADHALDLRLCGVANSRRMASDRQGLDPARWKEILGDGAEAMDLERFLAEVTASPCLSKVLLDCTAGDAVVPHYPALLDAGVHLVTPNKTACAAPTEFYVELQERAAGRFLYETTVGAGLPVISTLQDLLKSGDEIQRIDAVLSGSVSFILNSLAADVPLSRAVRIARDREFTEPDPRQDLGGLDMARKLLILARETGKRIELDEVQVESVVPLGDPGSPVEEFLEGLGALDASFEARRAAAAQNGRVLRYVGTLDEQGARVGLVEVDERSPFHPLRGSENMVIFTSRRYRESPLVVRGPGAGPEVTAAGVLADVIRTARRRPLR